MMHQYYRKRQEAQLQVKASPYSPIFSEKWPHPMDDIIPTNLCKKGTVKIQNQKL